MPSHIYDLHFTPILTAYAILQNDAAKTKESRKDM